MIRVLLNVRRMVVRWRGHVRRTAVGRRLVVIALRILCVVHHKCGRPSVGRAVAMKRSLIVLGPRGGQPLRVEGLL